jgi:hypothetical protein
MQEVYHCDWRAILALARRMDEYRRAGRNPRGLRTVQLRGDDGYLHPFGLTDQKDIDKAIEIYNIWGAYQAPPVQVVHPSPVGGATSAPSGGNEEGFGPDGKIVTAGKVPSTGFPDVPCTIVVDSSKW